MKIVGFVPMESIVDALRTNVNALGELSLDRTQTNALIAWIERTTDMVNKQGSLLAEIERVTSHTFGNDLKGDENAAQQTSEFDSPKR